MKYIIFIVFNIVFLNICKSQNFNDKILNHIEYSGNIYKLFFDDESVEIWDLNKNGNFSLENFKLNPNKEVLIFAVNKSKPGSFYFQNFEEKIDFNNIKNFNELNRLINFIKYELENNVLVIKEGVCNNEEINYDPLINNKRILNLHSILLKNNIDKNKIEVDLKKSLICDDYNYYPRIEYQLKK